MIIRTPGDLGAAIRQRRKLAGLDLTAAAELLGVSRRLLIELEHGRREASIATVLRMCSALGLEIHCVPRGTSREAGQ